MWQARSKPFTVIIALCLDTYMLKRKDADGQKTTQCPRPELNLIKK